MTYSELISKIFNVPENSETYNNILNSGFSGIFDTSLDKPHLDNHLFILFKKDITSFMPMIYLSYENRKKWYELIVDDQRYIVIVIPNTFKTKLNKELPLEMLPEWKQKERGITIDTSL